MIDALYLGATGMLAQQANVSNIANNLSNVNTNGFKRGGVQFSEMVGRGASKDGTPASVAGQLAERGLGVRVEGIRKSFDSGEIKQTNNPLDLAIRGTGFFELLLPDGSVAYTRNGRFSVNNDGLLASLDGYPLKQNIEISTLASEVVIDSKGSVYVKKADDSNLREVGQIQLAVFRNPEGLQAIGEGLYLANQESGEGESMSSEDDGYGQLAQGYIEASNVQLADEMVNLVLAQRAYELNAKIIQVADEMLSIGNNLRR